MTKVLVSGRVLDVDVGGNSRYARTIYRDLGERGIEHRVRHVTGLRGSARSAAFAFVEGVLMPSNPGRDIDLIHYPADTGAVIAGKIPILSTVHGIASLHIRGVRSPAAERLWRARVGRLIEISQRVITVSESSARDLSSVFAGSAHKLIAIPHGIDHRRFVPEAGGDHEVQEKYGLPNEYFSYLGNLDPRKNLVELCAAARNVFALTGVPLVVVGGRAWNSVATMAAVQNTPGVIYLGRLPDDESIPLIRSSTAFCFPSLYEGFGFPVLEAMAMGVPVICSDKGSLREVASDAALLLDSTGASSIQGAMLDVLNSNETRKNLRERGIVNAARFTWSRSVDEHLRVMQAIS